MKTKATIGSRKQSVIVKDLKATKNPKGGAVDMFLKIGDIKGESVIKLSGPSRLGHK